MKKLLLIFFLVFLFSCKATKEQEVYSILSDVFIDIVEESTYDYYKFLPAPNEPLKKRKEKGQYLVLIGDSMPSITQWSTSLRIVLSRDGDFVRLLNSFENSQSTVPVKLKYSNIRNTGLFSIEESKKYSNRSENVVGTLIIYQPIIEKDKGCLIITKFSSEKSGLTELLLLQKEKGKWSLLSRHDLERW